MYENCTIEGLEEKMTKQTHKNCDDDPTWFVMDKGGRKHTCSDIGISASCYDYDSAGRDGWSRCFKTCGICENSFVSKVPMNVMATFSGDPIEDFGVVLHKDSAREWIGKQDKEDQDIRNLFNKSDTPSKELLADLQSRYKSMEYMMDIISGNVISCVPVNKRKSTTKTNKFYGCRNQLISCPTVADPTGKHRYVKKKENIVELPATTLTCSKLTNEHTRNCDDYYLLDKVVKTGEKLSTSNTIITSLGDMCPKKCGRCK